MLIVAVVGRSIKIVAAKAPPAVPLIPIVLTTKDVSIMFVREPLRPLAINALPSATIIRNALAQQKNIVVMMVVGTMIRPKMIILNAPTPPLFPLPGAQAVSPVPPNALLLPTAVVALEAREESIAPTAEELME
jgi:hypothetical protein